MMSLNTSQSSFRSMLIVIVASLVGVIMIFGESVDGLASPIVTTTNDRRAFCASAVATVFAPTMMANAKSTSSLGSKDSVVEREKNTFAALINEFKNTDKLGGLDASTLNEPSIPFLEFGEKMKKGEVEFVEFMAPTGAVAYATIKGSSSSSSGKGFKKGQSTTAATGQRLRIGQGYPTGGKGSWSSPDFVIRSVSNYGVPYKFTVPALANAKYTKK